VLLGGKCRVYPLAPGRGGESRLSPENLPHNLGLIQLLKTRAKRKQATPAQIALVHLMAQRPFIVPIPGTTQMLHVRENIGADAVVLSGSELAELPAELSAITIQGTRLPSAVLQFSAVEAPEKA
jgi:aryl-alcohol dehydrogenase-like predicted oxidoreductase